MAARVHPLTYPLQLFLLFEQNRHGDDLEGPGPRQIHASLDMQLGAVEEPIERRLILLAQRSFEWSPGTTFMLDELAERGQSSTHTL
jgi:hypothetical protein